MLKRLGRIGVFALGLVAGFGTASLLAVNFTVVLTQAQVDIATWKWNAVDPSHTTYSTVNLFGAAMVSNLIAEYKNQRSLARAIKYGGPFGYFCVNTWTPLSQGAKDAECTSMGDVAGCTICDPSGN